LVPGEGRIRRRRCIQRSIPIAGVSSAENRWSSRIPDGRCAREGDKVLPEAPIGARDDGIRCAPPALRGAKCRAGANPPFVVRDGARNVGRVSTRRRVTAGYAALLPPYGAPDPMYFSRNACIRVRKSARSASV
jgi:hypothetical protein